MSQEILLSLLDEIQDTIKMNKRESKERKFETQAREIGGSCFNIYIVVFAFLSITIEKGRC